VSVAASIATHRMPMLLVVSASSIVKLNIWYMLWYRRRRLGVILPWSRSTRMYGRENTAVVRPTKAVSVTRNTFSGSMKNSSLKANIGPPEITRAVRAHAARKVPKLNATLMSRATSRWPNSASTTPPASGQPRTREKTSIRLVFEFFQVANVQAVELFADLEHEHAQDEHPDQDVQRDAQFDHHRHAVSR